MQPFAISFGSELSRRNKKGKSAALWCSSSKSQKFYLYPFIDSIDINWSNCFIDRAPQKLRRFMIKTLIVLIFFFVSSPVAFYNMIVQNEFINRIYNEAHILPGFFWKTYLPSLMIILINNLLIFTIFTLSKLTSRLGNEPEILALP